MSPQTLEKYRQAGVIAASALSMVTTQLHRGIGEQSIGEVCRIGDEFIKQQIAHCFKTVTEKGIARPTEICKNEFTSGISPEVRDTFQGGLVSEGDVVKVTLGVHIDGFTVLAGHTVVIREEQPVSSPLVGDKANAVIAAYLATEAVVGLLGSALTDSHPLRSKTWDVQLSEQETGRIGVNIDSTSSVPLGEVFSGSAVRRVVEEIAATFGCVVVPGSRVRRIKRFVVGQPTVHDSLPAVEWLERHESDQPLDLAQQREQDAQFKAAAGHSYLVDIQMAPRPVQENAKVADSSEMSNAALLSGMVKFVDAGIVGTAIEGPSIYTRDQTVTYQLRTAAARQLLSAVDSQLSVFPFKLSYIDTKLKNRNGKADRSELSENQLRLGLQECVQRHLLLGDSRQRAVFVPEFRPKQTSSVIVAREVCTLTLLDGRSSASGYPEVLRLSGGRAFPPSWTHSGRSLGSGIAADALNARLMSHQGVRYQEIKPHRPDGQAATLAQDMDIEA